MDRAADLGWERQERARFLGSIVTGALAPTNTLAENPKALKRALETGGASAVRGLRNLARDAATNGAMPRMVDTSQFRVGENLACTSGAVVFRDEMFEILQYAPTTPTVRQRPLVIVPPQLNRYFILDLAPGRSLVEYAVGQGIETFMVV